jgi:hypothetical protein
MALGQQNGLLCVMPACRRCLSLSVIGTQHAPRCKATVQRNPPGRHHNWGKLPSVTSHLPPAMCKSPKNPGFRWSHVCTAWRSLGLGSGVRKEGGEEPRQGLLSMWRVEMAGEVQAFFPLPTLGSCGFFFGLGTHVPFLCPLFFWDWNCTFAQGA